MSAPKFVIRFGDEDITDVIDSSTTVGKKPIPDAEVRLTLSSLVGRTIDYLADVTLSDISGPEEQRLFTGVVDTVRVGPTDVHIRLVTATEFEETKISGLAIANVNPLEIVWAICRMTGMADEQIRIAGYTPGPSEAFQVVAPIDGMLTRDKRIGDVQFSSDAKPAVLVEGLPASPLIETFTQAKVWATAFVVANTLYDAENMGLAQIEQAIAWLTARAHFSSATMPTGAALTSFSRAWSLGRPRTRDATLVKGLTIGRRWLRAKEDSADQTPVPVDDIEDFGVPDLSGQLSEQEIEAISAWRRALGARDLFERISALWEAIEFYASGAKVPTLFDRRQLKRLRAKANDGLSEQQRARVNDMIAHLNEPSLLMRLEQALADDGVPVTRSELRLLSNLRTVRNDFVHGRARRGGDGATLRHALAIVNRLLTYRVYRRSQQG